MNVQRIFNYGLTDDLFNSFFSFPYDSKVENVKRMNTDVKELDNEYQLDMELPGFDKSDIQVELKEGYLIIEAKKAETKDEKDSEGKYIRRERYSGSCKRKFYVGKNLTEEDVRATFENGILKLAIPKEDQRKAVEEKKYIAIE